MHMDRSMVLASFRLGIVCRSCGAAYFEFVSRDEFDISQVSFDCGVGSSPIPSSWYKLNDNTLVLSVPLMNEDSLSISGSYCGQRFYQSKWAWERIKWLSRFNYKARAEKTFFVRDSGNRVIRDTVHIRPVVCLASANKGELIIKGVVSAPADTGCDDIHVIDGHGIKLDDVDLRTGRSSAVCIDGEKRVETSFTYRFHESQDYSFCLVAPAGNARCSGFLCLNENSVRTYCGAHSPLFYRISSPGLYERQVAERAIQLSNWKTTTAMTNDGPTFSLIVPLFKTPIGFFNAMVESVRSQVYQNWELVLVNASPEIEDLKIALAKLTDPRVKVVTLDENRGISLNTNAGIEASTGDFIVFFDHDDVLDPLALFRYYERLKSEPQTDALYCNEDFLDEEGKFVAPHFKSGFNLDLLRVHNYITHLLCVRSELAKELMLRKEFDGAQDYDFLLRLVEKTRNIERIDEVLYHWRISETSTAKSSGNKGYADEAGRRALQEHLDRCGIPAKAECTASPCFYHIDYELLAEPKVSIVIPNKDSIEVLSRCIDSVQSKTTYKNYEILIVENNSTEKATFDYYDKVQSDYSNVAVKVWNGPFNYSAINNYGVGFTKGEYLLFLNNDVEIIEPSWLTSMLSFCQREDVGAVGAKLLYPDNTIQHAGVMMIKCDDAGGIGGPIHVFNNLDKDDEGYMRRASVSQDLSVVTAACMLTKRSVFEELKGFDESFVVAFNDVDYCLRLRESGRLVVFDADALLYHYESFSRGYETGEKVARFMREQGRLRTLWSEYYVKGDPYHSEMSTKVI